MPLRVTDILIRGGGGTVTFSDNKTLEFIYRFFPDNSIVAGGVFGMQLSDDNLSSRSVLVYQNVLDQSICDIVDWLLSCSSLGNAIHDNVSGEIAAITEKIVPVGDDILLLEDSADGNAKKRLKITNLPGGVPSAHAVSHVQGSTDPLDSADVGFILANRVFS